MCQNMSSWSSVGRLKFLELLSQWWFKPGDFFGITEDRKFQGAQTRLFEFEMVRALASDGWNNCQ